HGYCQLFYLALSPLFSLTRPAPPTLLTLSLHDALPISYRTLPQVAGNPERNPMRELSAFRNPRLWLMLAVGAIGFGGFFAVYSYIAEATTQAAGLPASEVPWVLATLGIGMTIGNVIGGWASDRDLTRTLLIGFSGLVSVMALYALLADNPIRLFVD